MSVPVSTLLRNRSSTLPSHQLRLKLTANRSRLFEIHRVEFIILLIPAPTLPHHGGVAPKSHHVGSLLEPCHRKSVFGLRCFVQNLMNTFGRYCATGLGGYGFGLWKGSDAAWARPIAVCRLCGAIWQDSSERWSRPNEPWRSPIERSRSSIERSDGSIERLDSSIEQLRSPIERLYRSIERWNNAISRNYPLVRCPRNNHAPKRTIRPRA